jgi:hypothetical protein
MSLDVAKLEDVARVRDSERRRELLGTIAELFLAGNAEKTNRERALFSDIFLRTIDELDAGGRRDMSEKLAASTETPRDVAMRLAQDEAGVADPVLRLSPVLEDDDLVEIARSLSNDHLISISRRDRLSENVTDVLIDRGDTAVMRNVAANDGARLSENGVRTLADRAGGDAIVRQNLAGRMDLPEAMLKRFLPKVSGEVAFRLRQAFSKSLDKAAMGEAMARAEKAFAGARLESSRGRVEALVAAKEIAAGKRDAADVFVGFAAGDRFIELVTILAKLVDLPEAMVTNLMYMTENAPFVIMCRSIGLARDGFVPLSELRCRRLKLPSSHGNHAIAEFDAIPADLAKRFVRFVNLRMAI